MLSCAIRTPSTFIPDALAHTVVMLADACVTGDVGVIELGVTKCIYGELFVTKLQKNVLVCAMPCKAFSWLFPFKFERTV